MKTIHSSDDLVDACLAAVREKTLYVRGAFGWPMTDENKQRALAAYAYNRRADRAGKIAKADSATFGFDCVCFLKALLWGWTADSTKRYGGAVYLAGGVPDVSERAMIAACNEVSRDFTALEPGEMLWMPGHMGIYVGDGLAVECTPAWADGVQVTAVLNIGRKEGFPGRTWVSHGRLPYVTYPERACFSVAQWQQAAAADGFAFPKYGTDGIWGADCAAVAARAVCRRRGQYLYPALTKLVQQAVRVEADGKFGPKTEKAVKQWQQARGLAADGQVGILTWKKMLGVK